MKKTVLIAANISHALAFGRHHATVEKPSPCYVGHATAYKLPMGTLQAIIVAPSPEELQAVMQQLAPDLDLDMDRTRRVAVFSEDATTRKEPEA